MFWGLVREQKILLLIIICRIKLHGLQKKKKIMMWLSKFINKLSAHWCSEVPSDSATGAVITKVPECPNEEDMGISGSLLPTWNIYLSQTPIWINMPKKFHSGSLLSAQHWSRPCDANISSHSYKILKVIKKTIGPSSSISKPMHARHCEHKNVLSKVMNSSSNKIVPILSGK